MPPSFVNYAGGTSFPARPRVDNAQPNAPVQPPIPPAPNMYSYQYAMSQQVSMYSGGSSFSRTPQAHGDRPVAVGQPLMPLPSPAQEHPEQYAVQQQRAVAAPRHFPVQQSVFRRQMVRCSWSFQTVPPQTLRTAVGPAHPEQFADPAIAQLPPVAPPRETVPHATHMEQHVDVADDQVGARSDGAQSEEQLHMHPQGNKETNEPGDAVPLVGSRDHSVEVVDNLQTENTPSSPQSQQEDMQVDDGARKRLLDEAMGVVNDMSDEQLSALVSLTEDSDVCTVLGCQPRKGDGTFTDRIGRNVHILKSHLRAPLRCGKCKWSGKQAEYKKHKRICSPIRRQGAELKFIHETGISKARPRSARRK